MPALSDVDVVSSKNKIKFQYVSLQYSSLTGSYLLFSASRLQVIFSDFRYIDCYSMSGEHSISASPSGLYLSTSSDAKGSSRPIVVGVRHLVHYQKPTIGNSSSSNTNPAHAVPVQVIFPSGVFCIGMPWKDESAEQLVSRERSILNAVLVSGPDESDPDQWSFRSLQIAFYTLGLLNIAITSYLFFRADAIDFSRVEVRLRSMPQVFGVIASERRRVEEVNYFFTVLLIAFGCVSIFFRNSMGISAYCLSVILNFVLGTSSLPYFMYSFRYLFDVVMLYMGLVLRSRLMVTFLPLPVPLATQHNDRNR